jgi:hypothetical protein
MKNILIFLFNLVFCAINAQQGIGTNNPDPSSILEIASTTKGLLIPRMTSVELEDIDVPVQGLMVYCTTCSPKAIYTYDTSSENWVTSVTNSSVSIREITSGSETWMARDLGASRSISSTTDIASYGDLYQWGRGTDGHEKWDSTIISKTDPPSPVQNNFVFVTGTNIDWRYIVDDTLWNSSGELSDNNPCPVGYRLPTPAELENHAANINLHYAGQRNFNGNLEDQGSYGTYWTSTSGIYIKIEGSTITSETAGTAFGRCVRCIKN